MQTAKSQSSTGHKSEAGAEKAKTAADKPVRETIAPNPLWHRLATYSGLGRAVQTKMHIGAANDPYEREADRVAERVMRMPAPAVQAKST